MKNEINIQRACNILLLLTPEELQEVRKRVLEEDPPSAGVRELRRPRPSSGGSAVTLDPESDT